MKHTPKIVEDAVEKFKKRFAIKTKFFDLKENKNESTEIEKWLTKTLTHIHTQAKEEERERVIKILKKDNKDV